MAKDDGRHGENETPENPIIEAITGVDEAEDYGDDESDIEFDIEVEPEQGTDPATMDVLERDETGIMADTLIDIKKLYATIEQRQTETEEKLDRVERILRRQGF